MREEANPVREADAYIEGITTIISLISTQFEKPELSEVLTALGCIEAHFIAGIDNATVRQKMVEKLRELVDSEIERKIEAGEVASVRLTQEFEAANA